ncbi:hypothetical protein ACP275_12G121300 [Erythranthe tilingii]
MSSGLDNSVDIGQEQVCYVQCGFCSTVLLVSVPCSSLTMVVTVRCGHCTSILSVNMVKACFVPLHLFTPINNQQQELMVQPKWEVCSEEVAANDKNLAANNNNTCSPSLCFSSDEDDDDEDSINRFNGVIHKPPEKKQRAPSAYNHFIKEEIKRLKIEYPNMTHKQAFGAAAKNWAHCPQSVNKGGEVLHSCDERDNDKMAINYSDVVDNEVHCFGNGFHERKALMQSICTKTRFY